MATARAALQWFEETIAKRDGDLSNLPKGSLGGGSCDGNTSSGADESNQHSPVHSPAVQQLKLEHAQRERARVQALERQRLALVGRAEASNLAAQDVADGLDFELMEGQLLAQRRR